MFRMEENNIKKDHNNNDITLMMEAVSISEMLDSLYQSTWHKINEEIHLHICCHENLKSQEILQGSSKHFPVMT